MKAVGIISNILLAFTLSFPSTQTSINSSAPTPDFSGTWKLDRKLSSNHKSLGRLSELTLVILQDNFTLKVVRIVKVKKKERVQELTYHADGRGEKNPDMLSSAKITSQ